MTRVAITSDWHGYIPPEIPECDLLVMAGDIGYSERFDDSPVLVVEEWHEFIAGLKMPIVAVAGNHDFYPEILKDFPWTYIKDEVVEVAGLKIWGSPWSNPFGYDWAYNMTEERQVELFKQIPDDVDIVISHGPPFELCDLTMNPWSKSKHVGSKALRARMESLSNLKLVACGHIHSGYGQQDIVVNGSLVNEDYWIANSPIVVTL